MSGPGVAMRCPAAKAPMAANKVFHLILSEVTRMVLVDDVQGLATGLHGEKETRRMSHDLLVIVMYSICIVITRYNSLITW